LDASVSRCASKALPVKSTTRRSTVVLGIDLAWGERMPDGVCAIRAAWCGAEVLSIDLVRGDRELLAWIATHAGLGDALIAVDGPLVCPNLTGTRPVDRATQRLLRTPWSKPVEDRTDEFVCALIGWLLALAAPRATDASAG
jgi:predicted RNase H-like nuclease